MVATATNTEYTPTIGQIFPPDIQAMEVSLSPTVCYITPKILDVNFPKFGKPLQDANLVQQQTNQTISNDKIRQILTQCSDTLVT